MPRKKTLLFCANYRVMQGAQLKTWHYFQHARHSPAWEPRVFFHPETVWDGDNPWRDERTSALREYHPHDADALFIDGRHNWVRLPVSGRFDWPRPIVASIQGFRHVHPHKRHVECLEHRAVRCCVSEEVRAAVLATGRVRGSTCVIPNGVDLPVETTLGEGTHPTGLLVCGLKKPALAGDIAARLRTIGRRVEVLVDRLSRAEFLLALGRASTTLFLPEEREGFYLPALEGMALGTRVICPDVVGNRSFCLDGLNCLRPDYRMDDLLAACEKLHGYSTAEHRQMVQRGYETASLHALGRERQSFLSLLDRLDDLWLGPDQSFEI